MLVQTTAASLIQRTDSLGLVSVPSHTLKVVQERSPDLTLALKYHQELCIPPVTGNRDLMDPESPDPKR